MFEWSEVCAEFEVKVLRWLCNVSDSSTKFKEEKVLNSDFRLHSNIMLGKR